MQGILADGIGLFQTLGEYGVLILVIYLLFTYIFNQKFKEFNEIRKEHKDAVAGIKKLVEFIADPTYTDGRSIPLIRLYDLLDKHVSFSHESVADLNARLDIIEEILSNKCDADGCPFNDCSGLFISTTEAIKEMHNDFKHFNVESKESRTRTIELISEIGESINKFISEFGLQFVQIAKDVLQKGRGK